MTIQRAEDYVCTSQILDCQQGLNHPDEPLSHVRIVLTTAGSTTHLVLAHDGLGIEAVNYLPGWHKQLLYLEDLLLGQPRSMADFWSTYERLTDS